jgi:two-component system chemotaxis sensor kinase CheA
MNEFVEQFLVECRELIEQATADLLALEENPGDSEKLDGAFRAFHTLKGSAGIVDFTAMAKAAHAAEDVLAQVRAGKIALSRELVTNCLACLSLVSQWLDSMAADGKIPADSEVAAQAVADRISGSKRADPEAGPQAKAEKDTLGLPYAARQLLETQLALLKEGEGEGFSGRLLSAGAVAVNILKSCGFAGQATELERIVAEDAAAEDGGSLIAALEALLKPDKDHKTEQHGTQAPDMAARVLRVDVERIDTIVRLTGELLVAKNAIGYAVAAANQENSDPKLLAVTLREQHAVLERLVGQLQRAVLGMRVLPLRHVFQRFPRLVRDLAESLGKPVKLISEGDNTEADKLVVEGLYEPLLHILRNALDHGVEPAADRAAQGKPAIATVTLRAARTGDRVVVEVEDDGRGIDTPKVRQVAAERGIATPEALAAMTDEDAMALIFAPGFSTARTVTDLSGRGVGMDVVRANVERLGGQASISSVSGRGTVVKLTLPFSVMLTRVLTVMAGGQTFGIPLDGVVETLRLPRGRVSPVAGGYAFVFRRATIPLIDLAAELGELLQGRNQDEANVVVVSLGGMTAGLEVERLGERMDIMLRPMDGLLSGTPGIAGTSLLGDGRVLIILDLNEFLD